MMVRYNEFYDFLGSSGPMSDWYGTSASYESVARSLENPINKLLKGFKHDARLDTDN